MEEYLQSIGQHRQVETDPFEIIDHQLHFQGINMMEIIETYGSPLKFTYLPVISKQIQLMKQLFRTAMVAADYRGKHIYCYCTKSSHFSYVVEEALKNDIGLEISSAFDIPLVLAMLRSGKITKETPLICNGFKTEAYKQGIADLIRSGYEQVVPILDNRDELSFYRDHIDIPFNLGIRIAAEDRPTAQLYTSRLGIRKEEIIDFYKSKIAVIPNIRVTTLHFFIDSGISDTPFYWEELEKNVAIYCQLKHLNSDLNTLDIGGGMPFKDSLQFNFNYALFVEGIIKRIKNICRKHQVEEPDIITEFGKYTVAESSGTLYKVLGRKQQNNKEKWLMLDGSFITNLPDTWAINQKYILLPLNNMNAVHEQVYLGGITCDGDDYYHMGANQDKVLMPKTRKTQYLGFFHTGAYQEVLSGFGGIHHCLLPSPKHIVISRNDHEVLEYKVFSEEQNSKQVLKILGYI